MIINAYTPNEKPVFADGRPVGGVLRVEESERWSEYPVCGFSDGVPSSILMYDRRFEIILEREVTSGDGVDFCGAEEFELKIGNTVYSGCRCTEIRKTKNADDSQKHKIMIAAATRQEVVTDE